MEMSASLTLQYFEPSFLANTDHFQWRAGGENDLWKDKGEAELTRN